ncbi:MAG: DMT family transporter [Pseudomonadota bacterium]
MQDTRPIAAAVSVLVAMAVIGFIDNFVIVIAQDGGLWQFHATRTLMALPCLFVLSVLGLGAIRPNRFWAVAGRSFFVSASMILYFGSLAFLPISEVAAGLFTAPIWVLVLSVAALGHKIGPVRITAALLGFAGVLFVLRPDSGSATFASLVPVAAGLLYALGALATREWCAGESTLSMMTGMFAAMGLWGLAGVAVLTVLVPEVPAGSDGFILRGLVAPSGSFLFWTLVQAAGSIVALWFLVKGYQLGEASYSAVFEYSLLIFVALWAYILRAETLDGWALTGTALIILSGAVIALRGQAETAARP